MGPFALDARFHGQDEKGRITYADFGDEALTGYWPDAGLVQLAVVAGQYSSAMEAVGRGFALGFGRHRE